MPMSTRPPLHRCQGFTLLELAALLALLAGLVFALLYKTTDVSVQRATQDSTSVLASADAQLRQFAAWHGRLPCPDSNGDGIEDCGSVKGSLPYRTLGQATIGYTAGEQGARALRYGVYRNAEQNADLAVAAERFKPTNADATAYDLNNRNSLDFCSALQNASAATFSDTRLFASDPQGARTAMAYMLASPGDADADGANGLYDGLNGTAMAGFASPETPISPTYDDATRGRGFTELYELLHCEATQRSLHLSANAIALEEENVAFAGSNESSATQGVLMNAVGTAISIWSLGQAAAGVASANEVATLSASLLAGATASCAIPPFVGCALIPVYTAAVSAAGTGVGLSIAALTLSGTALGLQGAATGLYVVVSEKTGVPDTSGTNSGVTQQMVDDAYAEYQQANTAALIAENAYQTALPGYLAKIAAASVTRGDIEQEIDKLPLVDRVALRDALYGLPRPEDIDPDNPPSDPLIGVEQAIDAWQSAVASAEQMEGVDLVDADGNPILDEDGNEVDLAASAAAAKEEADKRIADTRKLASDAALASCGGSLPCDLQDSLGAALDAHIAAYGSERTTSYEIEALQAAAENARRVADGKYDGYAAFNCAYQFNQDYDPQTNSCMTSPPGSSTQSNATAGVCDSNSESYDASACQALQDSLNSNPLCDTSSSYYDATACAALGSTPGVIVPFNGMENLVRQLDGKGSVQ